ncbi:MAG TPA: GGDEF domain-containing protein [Candidatus Baltobacteraceae bacterium]|nr:GGDEF domain-containing protein [Candidatus Baltobacteraceae bacterium]
MLEASRRSSAAVLAALDRMLRQLDSRIDSMLVFAPSGDELACIYASGAPAEHFRSFAVRRDAAALPARAAANGCRALFPHDGDAVIPTDRAALAVPMVDGRSVRATIYVSSRAACVLPSDAIVGAVTRAAVAYAMAMEREADRADATHDGLTGLLAPRAFRSRLHEELVRTQVSAQRLPITLWFVDTDSFKEVNDRFGHRCGDGVLQMMAALLQSHLVPELDLAARNGGDEFCALVCGATKTAAIDRAQSFCEAVRRHDFGLPLRITASVGVASYPFDAYSSSALLEAADGAMYHSKHNGRDRVSFLTGPGTYACVRAEAATAVSRSLSRWRSDTDESFTQRSPLYSCSSPDPR